MNAVDAVTKNVTPDQLVAEFERLREMVTQGLSDMAGIVEALANLSSVNAPAIASELPVAALARIPSAVLRLPSGAPVTAETTISELIYFNPGGIAGPAGVILRESWARTIGDFRYMTQEYLSELRNVGPKRLAAFEILLAACGIRLGELANEVSDDVVHHRYLGKIPRERLMQLALDDFGFDLDWLAFLGSANIETVGDLLAYWDNQATLDDILGAIDPAKFDYPYHARKREKPTAAQIFELIDFRVPGLLH